MINFSAFTYNWTYHVAASTRDRIMGENSLVDVKDLFEPDAQFKRTALNPSQDTFLHQVITHCLYADNEYALRKQDNNEYVADYLAPLLSGYGIAYPVPPKCLKTAQTDADEARNSQWVDALIAIYEQQAIPKVVQEVFTMMYADRETLRCLGEHIAQLVKSLKVADHPDLLAADGKVHRCTYWPTWLRQGLVYRDKGRCSLCLCDLSGLLAAGVEVAIDHIVSLNQGGTNDPTNLQMLCAPCNLKKSGNTSVTTGYQALYWAPEP